MTVTINKTGGLIKFLRFLLIFIFVVIFVRFDFYKFVNNTDNSWAMGLNLAIKNNFIFGKDIIFTYGPLGYLMTGLPIYASVFNILIFKLFLILNSIYVVKHFYYYSDYNFILVIPLLIISNFLFSSHIDLLLFFFFLFNLFLYSKNGNIKNLFIIIIISLLSIYIKLNTGVIINFIFIISIIYFKKPKYILVYFVYFSIHYILISSLKINFKSYLLNGFEIINYYNDAMYIPSKFNSLITALIIIFILLSFTFYIVYKKLILDKKYIKFHLLLSLFYLFILFKQSFVRSDISHNETFFLAFPYLFLFQSFFFKKSKINIIRFKFIFVILTIISIPFINNRYILQNNLKSNFNYFTTSDNNNNFLKTSSIDILPDRFLNIIKNKSVDVLPTDINVIYFNKLNYCPRPIIQSYAAYSKNFLNLNLDKYNSENGPEFIIYHDGVKIDKQHPFWQDSFVEIAMIQNYDIIDSFTFKNKKSIILLKKSFKNLVYKKKLIIDSIVNLNSVLSIPKSNNMIFMECEIEYTFIGKFLRFFYQPSPLNIKLYDSNNKSNIIKGIIPLLGSGVLVNKALLNQNGSLNLTHIYNLIQNKGYTTNNKIKEIVFLGNSRFIKNKFKIKFYEYYF
jgi:hypothetical protein